MGWIKVEHDGKVRRLAVAKTADGIWVAWPGGVSFIEPEREDPDQADENGVVAPLTGKVIRLEVGPGDAVESDQVLVVLEAMKMEYRLTAPRAGHVENVHCSVGDLVDQGDPLVTLTE